MQSLISPNPELTESIEPLGGGDTRTVYSGMLANGATIKYLLWKVNLKNCLLSFVICLSVNQVVQPFFQSDINAFHTHKRCSPNRMLPSPESTYLYV